MEALTHIVDKEAATLAFAKVFFYLAPRMYFSEYVEKKIIVYPTGWGRKQSFWRALTQASLRTGERFCYATRLNFKNSNVSEEEKFIVDLYNDSYRDVDKAITAINSINNAYYSLNANWCVYDSDDWYMLVGGTSKFIEYFLQEYPEADEEAEELIYEWFAKNLSESERYSYAQKLLKTIYNEKEYAKIVAEYIDD